MPSVEAPFIIATIRQKEKSLLGENELTRIMHAQNANDAREVLMSTPYAQYLEHNVSVSDAVTHALEAEYAWLADQLDNQDIVSFIGARYDALHIGLGILALHAQEAHIPAVPAIGTLSHEALEEMIFGNQLPNDSQNAFWRTVIAQQKQAIADNTWSTTMMYTSLQQALERRLTELARTPLTRAIATRAREHHEADEAMRAGEMQTSAVQYEYDWDKTYTADALPYRFDPIGYDPIVAYWTTKELEGKTIRLIFGALAGGFTKEEIQALARPLIHV